MVNSDALPTFSVIIPSFNGGELTLDCVGRFLEQLEPSDELLVMDNGSRDGTGEILAGEFGEKIRLTVYRSALGFGTACNRGAASAHSDFLVFANQDLIPEEGCLRAVRTAARQHPKTILGVRILEPEGRTIQHLGGMIQTNALTQHRGRGENDRIHWGSSLLECDYVNGAFFVVQREFFHTLNGFDERFNPAYFEEADFCVRAAAQNVPSLVVPWASARHFEAQTVGTDSLEYYFRYHRNRLRFVAKHYSRDVLRTIFIPAERAWWRSPMPPTARRGVKMAYAFMMLELARWLTHRRKMRPSFVPQEVAR